MLFATNRIIVRNSTITTNVANFKHTWKSWSSVYEATKNS